MKKLAGGTCERRWRLWVWQRPWIATTRKQPLPRKEMIPNNERYDSTGDVSAAMANTSSYNPYNDFTNSTIVRAASSPLISNQANAGLARRRTNVRLENTRSSL